MEADFLNPVYYSPDKYGYFKYHFKGLEDLELNYSQLHQDLFVLSLLQGLQGGFYVEIGASYPIHLSNTYLLEAAFNWQGIGIELDEKKVYKHRRLRKNKCLNINAMHVSYIELLRSSYAPHIIDYLSIDVDPSPVSLKTLKLVLKADEFKFRIITFEHDFGSGGDYERDESRRLLSNLGYELVVPNVTWGRSVIEDWWVKPELVDMNQLHKMRVYGNKDSTTDIHNYFYTKHTLL